MAHVQRRTRPGRRTDWLASYVGSDSKRHSKVFSKKIDAERFVHEMESRKLRGIWTNPDHGRELFGDWLEDWWKTTTNLRPGTRARDESYMKKHVKPRWAAVPLAKISQVDVRAWVAELNAKGLRPATVRLIYQILARALDAAVDGGMIPLSPCRRISLPKIERGEPRFLTREQVHAIADAVPDYYRTLILTAAYLGPRWGELAGLRPARVDLLHRKLHIVDQLTEVKGHIELGAPLKTPAARRTITIPRFLVPMLEEQISRNTELVFQSRDGTPMRRTNFRRRTWATALKSAKLKEVHFHDLRHTAVAFAIERGAHPRAIQERMGHNSITTTMDVYGGLFPRLEETIADGLDELYEATVGVPAG
jgi:integrase